MKNNKIYRQGDVLITPVSSIPEKHQNKKLIKTDRVTLALGEATGHHHSILDGSAVGYGEEKGGLTTFLEVTEKKGAPLTHQEHDTIVLPEGKYRVHGQTEYTPEAIVRVQD